MHHVVRFTALACVLTLRVLPAQNIAGPREPQGAEVLYRTAVTEIVEETDAVFDVLFDWKRGDPLTPAHAEYVHANAKALGTYRRATAIRPCRFDLTSKDGVITELETIGPKMYTLVTLASYDGLLCAAEGKCVEALARCRDLLATAAHFERHPRTMALGVAGFAEQAACDVAAVIVAKETDTTTRPELRNMIATRLEQRPSPESLLVADRVTTERALEHFMRASRDGRPDDDRWRAVTKMWRGELERRFEALHDPLRKAIDRRDPELLEEHAHVVEAMKDEHRALLEKLGSLDEIDPSEVPEDAARALPMYFVLLLGSDLPRRIRECWTREEELRRLVRAAR